MGGQYGFLMGLPVVSQLHGTNAPQYDSKMTD